MHASIEARVPFLTRYVCEAAGSLDEHLLIHGRTQKYALKKLAEKYVPHECLYRRKVGFDLPLAHWLRGPLREYMMENLQSSWQKDYLKTGAMARVIEDHLHHRNDNADKIWAFLLLENNVRALRAVTLEAVEKNIDQEAASRSDVLPSGAPLSVLVLSPEPRVQGGVTVFAETMKARLKHCEVTPVWVGSASGIKENPLAMVWRLLGKPFTVARMVRRKHFDVVHVNPTLDNRVDAARRTHSAGAQSGGLSPRAGLFSRLGFAARAAHPQHAGPAPVLRLADERHGAYHGAVSRI